MSIQVENEVEVRDAFGQVVERRGSFTVDVPLDTMLNGGTITAPDGTVITVTPDADEADGIAILQEAPGE